MQKIETQISLEGKVEKLETSLDNLSTRFARLLSDFNSTQLKLKQRITRMEKLLSHDADDPSNALLFDFEHASAL